MSAYQVSRAHVATLALFGEGGISRRFGGLVGLANLLAQANVESLKARYPQDEVEAHEFKNEAAVYNAARIELMQPLVMLKAVQCFEYQACEYEGWSASDAKLACSWLKAEAIRKLPGYDEAAGWSIEDAPKGAPRQISLMGLAKGAYKGVVQ